MSRLLQVIIALAGLAITGVLSLASVRSEHLQARHALMSLLTETVSTARATCDSGLADMASDMLYQLQTLERPGIAVINDNEDREHVRDLLEHYEDYLVELQGSIQGGECAAGRTPAPPASATAPADRVADNEAPARGVQAPAPEPIIPEQATANIELRQQEMASSRSIDFGRVTGNVRAERAQQRYYAVLASYGINDANTYDGQIGVVHDYQALARETQGQDVTLKVMRTSRSDHFAIVLVPDDHSRDGARALVVTARARGWSADAFVQGGDSWIECGNPTQISRTYQCATESNTSRAPS